MSCDTNRQRYFGVLTAQIQGALGQLVRAEELLELVYDVAASQPPPEGKAAQLAAAAAFSKLRAAAQHDRIALYPHTSQSGLPGPETLAAWQQVAGLLDAIEQGTPLPPLSQDAYQSLVFRGITTTGYSVNAPWNPPMSWKTRTWLRRAWAANPTLLQRTFTYGLELGPEAEPFLAELSEVIAVDPEVPRDLGAAAHQFLALQEADSFRTYERGAWARITARAAGFAIGGRVGERTGRCFSCGEVIARSTGCPCTDEDRRLAQVALLDALPLLADPLDERVPEEMPNTPRLVAEALLQPLMRSGELMPDPASPEAALLDTVRLMDRRRAQRLASELPPKSYVSGSDSVWLRDATLRTPVQFQGQPCIWENGYLYPEATFRQHADWQAGSGNWYMRQHAEALCEIKGRDLLRLVSGEAMPRGAVQLTSTGKLWYWAAYIVETETLVEGDIITFPCGCAYRCDAPADGYAATRRVRSGGSGCTDHAETGYVPVAKNVSISVLQPIRKKLSPPTWDAPTPVAAPEARNVV